MRKITVTTIANITYSEERTFVVEANSTNEAEEFVKTHCENGDLPIESSKDIGETLTEYEHDNIYSYPEA